MLVQTFSEVHFAWQAQHFGSPRCRFRGKRSALATMKLFTRVADAVFLAAAGVQPGQRIADVAGALAKVELTNWRLRAVLRREVGYENRPAMTRVEVVFACFRSAAARGICWHGKAAAATLCRLLQTRSAACQAF